MASVLLSESFERERKAGPRKWDRKSCHPDGQAKEATPGWGRGKDSLFGGPISKAPQVPFPPSLPSHFPRMAMTPCQNSFPLITSSPYKSFGYKYAYDRIFHAKIRDKPLDEY